MVSDNSMGDGQAQSRTPSIPFGREEGFEDVLEHFGFHPHPGIPNLDLDRFRLRVLCCPTFVRDDPSFKDQLPPTRHCLDGIEHNIEKYLLELLRVALHKW